MMRRNAGVNIPRGTVVAAQRPAWSCTLVSTLLAALLALLLSTTLAHAEPTPTGPAPAAAEQTPEMPAASTSGIDAFLLPPSGAADLRDSALGIELGAAAANARLADLLAVPDLSPMLSDAQTADAAIALAVERGSNRDLEPKKPFRKRNVDLFRTERPVEIGRQELVLRLRLRAKLKRAISVQLRF